MHGSRGIYVEIKIDDELEAIWRLSQDPALHQRWDLRFTRICYLPRPNPDQPQRFTYETRIGFGLKITGTGESVGERGSVGGGATSSLKFSSSDSKSLIQDGAGYWRYIPTMDGLRFLTWYDYSVRYGRAGRLVDRLFFRPLMGWATAWSFDRMRLWAEEGQTPETSLAFSVIHTTARIAIAATWIWHGLVPKLIYRNLDEQTMLAQAGAPLSALPWVGGLEALIGLLFLFTWRWRAIFPLNAAAMVLALLAVAVYSPHYLQAAFNPVTLNFAIIALSVTGWIASKYIPSSRRCLRVAPRGKA